MPTLYDSNSLAAKSPLVLVVPDRVLLMFPSTFPLIDLKRADFLRGKPGGGF